MSLFDACEDYLDEHPNLQNRLENGGLMAAATAPVFAFSAYKTLNDYGLPRSFTRIGLWTLGLSLAAGALWSLFPQAKNKATAAHEESVFKQYRMLKNVLVDNVNEHLADQQEKMILRNRAEDIDRESGSKLISYIVSPTGDRIPVYSKAHYGDPDYLPMMDFPDDEELGLHYQSMREWRNAYQPIHQFDSDMTGGDWLEDYSVSNGRISGIRNTFGSTKGSGGGAGYFDNDFGTGAQSDFLDRPLRRVNAVGGKTTATIGADNKYRLNLVPRHLMYGGRHPDEISQSDSLKDAILRASDNYVGGSTSNFSTGSSHLDGGVDFELGPKKPQAQTASKSSQDFSKVRETVNKQAAQRMNSPVSVPVTNKLPTHEEANLNTGRRIIPADPHSQAVLRVKAGDPLQDPDFTAQNEAVMLGYNNAALLEDDDEDLADKAWEEEMGKSWKSPPLDSVDKDGISLIRRTAMPPQNTDDWEMRDEDYDQPFM